MRAGNGTKVLGLADKRQSCWRLRTGSPRHFGGQVKAELRLFIAALVDAWFGAGNQAFDICFVLGDH
jgi:hypothetical protein